MDYNTEAVLAMTVVEFKAFKKAVQTLCRAGIMRDKAMTILLNAHIDSKMQKREGLYK